MDPQERIVEARLKLRERFLARMEATPSRSDAQPCGTGEPNRHGMPTRPPGQKIVQKWPVLDLGRQPEISLSEWRLTLDGACNHATQLTWEEFLALPQTEDVSDFHCVTGWSKLNMRWKGVRLADLAALADPSAEATHLLFHGYDGYTTNLPLEEALKSDVLLVYQAEGEPIARDHGGPVRMITPQLYAWKGCKWICRIQFLVGDQLGFWEKNGYANSAYPWREERYTTPAGIPSSSPNLLWRGTIALGWTLLWAAATLGTTALLIQAARHLGHSELIAPLKSVAMVAYFGAYPFTMRRMRVRRT